MPFGYADTKFVHFPEGQTEQRVRGLQNRLGINYLEFVRRVDAAMSALNRQDPLIGELTADTTNDRVTTLRSVPKVWQRGAEYTPGRPQRGGAGGGYSLPLYNYEIDLGFTDRGLMTMPTEVFTEELRTTVQAVAKGRRADVLHRLFFPGEVPLDDDGVGASPGFIGSGTGTNVFEGSYPNGIVVPANHTHYHQAANTDGDIDAALKLMLSKMQKWYTGPFDLIGSPDFIDRIQVATMRADDRFVSAGSSLIRPAEAQTQALVDANRYIGVYAGHIRVREADFQIGGMACAIIKPGVKQLSWRYDPLFGREAYVDDRQLTPLVEAMIMQTYGVGVGERTSATLLSVGGTAGVYAAPPIER